MPVPRDLEGIVILEDILQEIVAEFTTDFASNVSEIHHQVDGPFFMGGWPCCAT